MKKIKILSLREFASITTTIIIASIIALIIITPSVKAIQFSEVMFNPEGSDTKREWIEVTFNNSDGCVNLTKYKLFEGGANHNIVAQDNNLCARYAIICTDPTKFFEDYNYLNDTQNVLLLNVAIYKSSFSLANDGENLSIKLDEEIIDTLNYNAILSSINITEGYSIEQYIEDNPVADDMIIKWRQSNLLSGNPGNMIVEDMQEVNYEENYSTDNQTEYNSNISIDYNNSENTNNITQSNTENSYTNYTDPNNNIYNNTSNTTDYSINNLTSNTTNNNNNNNTNNITNNMTYNITSNNTNEHTNNTNNYVTNSQNISLNKCIAYISIIVKNESIIYDDSVQIKFYNKIEAHNVSINVNKTTEWDVSNFTANNTTTAINLKKANYSIEYWITDIYGNIIKNKVSTSNMDEKSFTPKIDESDKILVIHNSLKELHVENYNCTIINQSDKRIILIRNQGYTKESCPSTSSASCTCKQVKSESKCSSGSEYLSTQSTSQNCTSNPIVRTIYFCNESKLNAYMQSKMQNITGTYNLNSLNINEYSSNTKLNTSATLQLASSNTKSGSLANNQITGTITYESPNIKNRLYALLGLIIVGITCASVIIYKWTHKDCNESNTSTKK